MIEFNELVPFRFILFFNSAIGLLRLSNLQKNEQFDSIFFIIKELVKPLKLTKKGNIEEKKIFDGLDFSGYYVKSEDNKSPKKRLVLSKVVDNIIKPKSKFKDLNKKNIDIFVKPKAKKIGPLTYFIKYDKKFWNEVTPGVTYLIKDINIEE